MIINIKNQKGEAHKANILKDKGIIDCKNKFNITPEINTKKA